MTKGAFLLASALAAATTFAKPMLVYIGTFGASADRPGIFHTEFDTETGQFSKASAAAPGAEMSWLALSPDKTKVYASGIAAGQPRKGFVAAFERLPDNQLRLLRQQPNGADAAVHLSLTPDKRALLGANYSEATTRSWPLDADGLPLPFNSERSHTFSHPAGWTKNDRQNEPHPHGIHLAPDGRFAFVPDLGTDTLVAYAVGSDGALTHRPELDVTVPATHGPRHMTFSSDGRFAYELSELVARLRVYAYDSATGKLTLVQDEPNLPPDFTGEHSGAEVVISPNGRFLYASNRQSFESIAVYSRDTQTGKVALVQQWQAGLKHPRHFTFTSDGRWLLTTNTFVDQVFSARVNPETGMIGEVVGKLSVPKPTHLLIVE